MPGTGRQNGGWGLSRPGLSCSMTRLLSVEPPLASAQLGQPANDDTLLGGRTQEILGTGTSLVRALALHGVAKACAATWPHPLGRGEVS